MAGASQVEKPNTCTRSFTTPNDSSRNTWRGAGLLAMATSSDTSALPIPTENTCTPAPCRARASGATGTTLDRPSVTRTATRGIPRERGRAPYPLLGSSMSLARYRAPAV